MIHNLVRKTQIFHTKNHIDQWYSKIYNETIVYFCRVTYGVIK